MIFSWEFIRYLPEAGKSEEEQAARKSCPSSMTITRIIHLATSNVT
jgi:hypothetical protein